MTPPAPILTAQQQTELRALAARAGQAIMQIYAHADFGVTAKADDSPLTAADANAHQVLAEGLPAIANFPVLSEEGARIPWSERRGWQTYWLIDPLDGTKEFIKRNGEFTVNAALVHAGRAVTGVVFAPALGVTYFGSAGEGACKQIADQPPVPISAAAPPTRGERPWRIVGSRSHQSEEFVRFMQDYPGAELVAMGSSLKLCLVAEGAADLYPRLGPTSEWDTAAAQAVAEAAGAEVIAAETGLALAYNQKESLLNPHFIVRAGKAA